MARSMTWLRLSWVAIPSNPKPKYSVSSVRRASPSGNVPASSRVQLLAGVALPSAVVTVNAPNPSSKLSTGPVPSWTSSTNIPMFWTAQSDE